MLDRTERSSRCYTVRWNMEGLELAHVQGRVQAIIASRFTNRLVMDPMTSQWVLETEIPTYVIPQLVQQFTDEGIHIYEICSSTNGW